MIDSFQFKNGRIEILNVKGAVLSSYDTPETDGLYEIARDGTVSSIEVANVDAATGAVVLVTSGQAMGVKLPTYDLRPLKDITFQQAKTFVDGLTAQQLKNAVAWMLFQMRDNLPDDIRDRI